MGFSLRLSGCGLCCSCTCRYQRMFSECVNARVDRCACLTIVYSRAISSRWEWNAFLCLLRIIHCPSLDRLLSCACEADTESSKIETQKGIQIRSHRRKKKCELIFDFFAAAFFLSASVRIYCGGCATTDWRFNCVLNGNSSSVRRRRRCCRHRCRWRRSGFKWAHFADFLSHWCQPSDAQSENVEVMGTHEHIVFIILIWCFLSVSLYRQPFAFGGMDLLTDYTK